MDGAHRKPDLHILLLGKTGTGKSATGNSIIGREAFKESDSGSSETAVISQQWTEHDKFIVKVIDGPGLEDTFSDKVKDKQRAIENIKKAVSECNTGVNAFVYVVKYGDRFTAEDRCAAESLKKIIGDRMGDFSVVVLTRGFDWLGKYKNCTLRKWCEDNDKSYNGIFSYCGYRCVLFENGSYASAEQKAKQVNELLTIVSKITMKSGLYTCELFEKSAQEREKMIVELNAPELKERFQRGICLLYDKMIKISHMPSNDEKIPAFRDLVEQAENLLAEIKKEDKQSGALRDLEKATQRVKQQAEDENDDCLEKLAAEIEQIQKASTKRSKLYTGISAVFSGLGIFMAGVATVATGGLALPALLGASAAASGTSLGVSLFRNKKASDDASTLDDKIALYHGKKP